MGPTGITSRLDRGGYDRSSELRMDNVLISPSLGGSAGGRAPASRLPSQRVSRAMVGNGALRLKVSNGRRCLHATVLGSNIVHDENDYRATLMLQTDEFG